MVGTVLVKYLKMKILNVLAHYLEKRKNVRVDFMLAKGDITMACKRKKTSTGGKKK